ASKAAAHEIAALIRERNEEGRPTVLGLATGSTPVGVYRELIRLHKEEGLSFRRVVSFNLDEYFSLPPEARESYHYFMWEQLFSHVDIRPENVHLPVGAIPRDAVAEACLEYEARIRKAGGIDLQILGIGRTGHIGFNEPGSTARSRTRIITLDHVTRRDNAPYFRNPEEVPVQALTMGIGTILEARRILLLAFGDHKAEIVQRAFEGEADAEVPASFLQQHDDTLVLLDPGAAGHLTRLRHPWLTGPLADLGLAWDDAMVRRAVTWLSRRAGKAVLKLIDFDYNEHGLQELLGHFGSAYDINLKVFRQLQKTITGWPAGRPAEIGPRRVLVFSPHPDDDVISMGGTLTRLAGQGHEVHIAYQASGGGSVPERAVRRYLQFAASLAALEGTPRKGEVGEGLLRPVKAAIRRIEAVQAAAICGIPEERLHFLDMPFYEARANRRAALTEKDVDLIRAVLNEVRPHQIYAAGDLADPHGTHKLCLTALEEALRREQGSPWMKDCAAWLYRGAWNGWELHEVEMAVPISPGEVLHKRRAIFQHETQKDQAMFLGEDAREFWQRAEERNRTAAREFNAFGLVEYEAIETFARMPLPV
ncbi:MAG TPA: glucosamine-6-phosphate deaminase, partial [Candidatus Methylacidiphilales bacterium]